MTQMRIRVAVLFALLSLFMVGEAAAAVCTSLSAGRWDQAARWSCGRIPATTDTVVIAHNSVQLRANSTVAGLTINAGAVLLDNGKNLTVSGSVVINGTYDGTGNNGNLIMTGNGQTLSGTGTIIDIGRIQIDANITIPVGANLNLTLRSEIRVGDQNPATLTVDGTITGTAQTNGNRIIRADNNNTSNVVINGTVNAPNSFVEIQSGGTVTNNGTVSLQYLNGDNSNSSTWLQGGNSNLTLTQPAIQWVGTFDASATGNTVTFNGTATPFNPATYYNIDGDRVTCPHPAGITVLGSSPCTPPLAEYRFDEVSPGTVADSSANGMNGAVSGGVIVGGPGKVCGSYNFNGADAFVSVPHNALLNQSQVTVMAWVRHASATIKSWEAILAKGDNAFRLHLNGGCSINAPNIGNALSFGINSGCATADADSGVIPATGQWYHVAGTYDGATIRIYVDGVLKASGAYAGAINSNTFPLYIGENSQQTGRYWNGDLDEVKIFGRALIASNIAAGYANENAGKNWNGTARTCPVYGPHHIEIQHDGNGLTCSADTVTIRACADNANPCTLYTAGADVTLTPGGQTFAIGATGINSAASVQQSTATAPGVPVTLSAVSVPAATDATPTTCWNTVTSTASCAMTFSDSGFVVTAPDHVSCNNASVTIKAVEAAPGTGRCVPAYQNVTRAVNLKCAYVSPATGTLPVNAAGVALNSANNASAACDGTGQSPSLSFDGNGTTTISLNYADAGKLTLTASDTAPTGKAMTGSGTFVVAPASFAFSGIPAAPLVAGQAFNATVTAMNACATPATTPNFTGQTVAITSSNPQPGLGNATAINTSLTATSGTGSANLTWGEVGTIDLDASLSNYLGSALSISGSRTGVGRFRPAYFDTAVSGLMACPAGLTCPASNDVLDGFIYSGQPFKVKVIAKSLTGNATANYQGATYAHDVTLTAWDALGSTTTPNAGADVLANNAVAATDFAAGVAMLATPTYTFGAVQTAPTDIFIRAKESPGADNVTSLRTVPATSVEGGVTVASGRIKLSNGHGSELLALPLAAIVQYYNGSAWVRSDTDTVTTMAASDFALAFPAGTASRPNNLAACETALAVAGTSPTFALNLSAPGSGNNGWTNLTLNLGAAAAGNRCTAVGAAGAAATTANRPWLQFPSGADPTVRATFGVYKGNNEFIYLRENY